MTSDDPYLRFAFWLLRFFILLLGGCSTGHKGSGAHSSETKDTVLLKGIQGGSVLFHMTLKPEVDPAADVQETSLSFGPVSEYQIMFQVSSGTDSPKWVSLEDKYKQRIHVFNMTTLRIKNLTLQDSGYYQAQIRLTEGRVLQQTFHLIVYETVPLPQILTKSQSITPGWCNVTLECSVPGTSEKLTVIWEIKDLEQRETPGPVTDSWTLAVSLPVVQPQSLPNTSITCVVRNPKDQKNVTLDMRKVCVQKTEPNKTETRTIILGAIVAVLMVLGAGLFLLKTYGKKMKKKTEAERDPGLQEDSRDDDGGPHYLMLNLPKSLEGNGKGIHGQHLEEKEAFTVVYSNVPKPDGPQT